MEISWDQIIFDNTLLGQVPEEGVSRLVTQQISERRDHYIRYGLAFMLEHGFMKTDRGRLCYRMNLEQARPWASPFSLRGSAKPFEELKRAPMCFLL